MPEFVNDIRLIDQPKGWKAESWARFMRHRVEAILELVEERAAVTGDVVLAQYAAGYRQRMADERETFFAAIGGE